MHKKNYIALSGYASSLLIVLTLTMLVGTACGEPLLYQEALRSRVELLRGNAVPASIPGEQFSSIASLQRFYKGRAFEPVWNDRDDKQIRALIAAVSDSRRHGLKPNDYHLKAMDQLLEAAAGDAAKVDLELLASDAWMLLASHYASGRLSPNGIDNQWRAARRNFNAVQAMEKAVKEKNLVGALQQLYPVQPGYRRLTELLEQLRTQSDWPLVSAKGELKQGERRAGIITLKRRLQASGELSSSAQLNDLYDHETENALKQFQQRYGLKPDGVLGAATLDALNTTREQRIRQVTTNLDRWRWLPDKLGRRHIRVNIADFSVEAWENGRPVLTMKAIIGRAYRRTPVFSANMSYLVFNPFWEVPPSIAIKDKLPLLRKNAEQLRQSGFEVLSSSGGGPVAPTSINWNNVTPSAFPYRLRQKPGPANALGQVKLMFPNPYNVYLHDTSERPLFEKDIRTYSSGCIRVQKPVELAAWALAGQPGWNLERVQRVIASGETTTVNISPTIPVHVEYWTAWVDEDGKPRFRADIYGRDQIVDKALTVRRLDDASENPQGTPEVELPSEAEAPIEPARPSAGFLDD